LAARRTRVCMPEFGGTNATEGARSDTESAHGAYRHAGCPGTSPRRGDERARRDVRETPDWGNPDDCPKEKQAERGFWRQLLKALDDLYIILSTGVALIASELAIVYYL